MTSYNLWKRGILLDMDEKIRKYFKYGVLLIFFAIAMYACFMNLGSVIDFFVWLIDITTPILIGVILAIVLNAPMRGFRRLVGYVCGKIRQKTGKKVPTSVKDTLSLVLTLIATFLLIFLVFSIVVPRVVRSVASIGDTFAAYYPKLLSRLRGYGIDTSSLDELVAYLDLETLIHRISENASDIFGTAFSAASSVLGTVLDIFTGLIIAIYILASKKKLKRQCKKLVYAYVELHKADVICNVAQLCSDTFFHFISGQCLDACILGVMFYIVMSILGMPYTAVISMLIGFMALIPYIGAFIGMLVGFFLIVMIDPMQALVFLVVFLILQQVEGQLIYPRVVGNSVGLPAIWTLLAALLGGALFGLVGMLLFIPLTSVAYTLLRDNMNQQLERKGIHIK